MTKEFITIIDYGSGNLRSAAQAAEHAAKGAGLDVDVRISNRAEDVAGASHLILPGQGAFRDCMDGLKASGLIDALEDAVLHRKVPFLGICVGMQLLAKEGHEHGTYQGLGWLDAVVDPIDVTDHPDLKIPHMGWNEVSVMQKHPVLDGIETGEHFYFVHSYHMALSDPDVLLLESTYGRKIVAAVAKDNIVGVQFHPEKSADAGLRLIGNFLKWQI